MKSIIIVDCKSTGRNFIKDIVRRNYNPVVLEPKFNSKSLENVDLIKKLYEEEYNSIDEDFDLIYQQDTFEETIELVKKFDPILILPGSENGVILANKLSNELGLLANPNEVLDAMTLKNEMQNALKRAGIRYIKGKVIYSLEEALEYYKECGLTNVVVKPIRNSCSFGVTICSNEDEVRHAVETTLGIDGLYGEGINALVIQERIMGDEYIVNTVSNKGVHRLTTMWKYSKKQTSEGNYIYDYMESVNELNITQAEMVEYAYQVADAIGIQYGPVHGEYMVDEKGPVLIEVNCRPMGGHMDEEFLDNISGQHETDSILDSYLNPKGFNYERMKKYRLFSYGLIKFFIVPEDIFAQNIPMIHIAKRLKSHYKTSMANITDSPIFFTKTKDLDTAGGIIYLNHEDYLTISKDLTFLCTVEHYAFSQVMNSGIGKTKIVESNNLNTIKNLLNKNSFKGTTLLITDEFIEDNDIVQCKLNQLDKVSNNFKIVLLNLNKSILNINSNVDTLNYLLNVRDKLKVGGMIIIPKNTYQYINGERNGMETLIKALNLRIEAPPYGIKDVIIATRT